MNTKSFLAGASVTLLSCLLLVSCSSDGKRELIKEHGGAGGKTVLPAPMPAPGSDPSGIPAPELDGMRGMGGPLRTRDAGAMNAMIEMRVKQAAVAPMGGSAFNEGVLDVDTERYGHIDENTVKLVDKDPVSTFGVDVDTGSYSNARRFLNGGRLPPVQAVRVEEMINYFPYRYPNPADSHPFSVGTEVVDSPWLKGAKLMKIGIAAVNRDMDKLPDANLVFLVDVSGSMSGADKLPLVKKTLRILTGNLRARDKVSIVTYASGERLALPATSGSNKRDILKVVDGLQARGATAGERALQMAYDEAAKNFVKNGINRIILATDGDFNVGITDFDTLKGIVSEKRKGGVTLTTLGFGTGNYNEHLMEQLADAGNGNYAYIDGELEARKVLGQQLSSTLRTVAQDVKIQVEFNPATVSQYRLVGYENRVLNREDFNNDRVDSGDVGAGHTVTAIYEFVPKGSAGWLDESRYGQTPAKTASGKSDEYAQVGVRYKRPGETKSVLMRKIVKTGSKPLDKADGDTRFAVAVATYGQLLRGGKNTGDMSWDDVAKLAKGVEGDDPMGIRKEFLALVGIARNLSTERPGSSGER